MVLFNQLLMETSNVIVVCGQHQQWRENPNEILLKLYRRTSGIITPIRPSRNTYNFPSENINT